MNSDELLRLIIALVTGGGGTTLLWKMWTIVKESRTGRLDREDTAITRWQAIAEREEREAEQMRWELDWYRANYGRLLVAYRLLPPQTKDAFPDMPTPPPPSN